MYVIDESGNRIEAPDLESGYMEERTRDVVHRYVVDVEEENHFEVVAVYPETGGQDVELVVDVEERGHWETHLASTGELVEFKGAIPHDAARDQEVPDVETYWVYKAFAPEELAEAKRIETEAARFGAFAKNGPQRLDAAEVAQADIDAAICALYELTAGGEA